MKETSILGEYFYPQASDERIYASLKIWNEEGIHLGLCVEGHFHSGRITSIVRGDKLKSPVISSASGPPLALFQHFSISHKIPTASPLDDVDN